jgi:uncharacterized protein YjeT (DUF2065 family)
MTDHIYGVVLIIFGLVYLIKPNIFRVGFWKKTAVTQQIFTPKQYNLYMRILGGISILAGCYFLFIK